MSMLKVSLAPPIRHLQGLAAGLVVALATLAGTPPATAGVRVDATVAAALDPAGATDRLIVKLREPALQAAANQRIDEIGGRFGERLRRLRGMSGGGHVVQLARRLSRGEAHALAQRLARDPAVAHVEPDALMQPLATPNDAYYSQQWSFYEPAGGINLPAAWDITTGASGITVGVIDSGVVAHADLAGRLVAGHDFIGDTTVSNDGDGRDPDASDPGDYGCEGSVSSWHGTHVAGTIGAAGHNGIGVAGVNWGSKIQPLRALGRCGGYTSDIVDAMRWAAGIAVPGVPANATPVRVINLSLGGSGACSPAFQNAVNDVTSRGVVVVVAAGNSNVDASGATPASCSGVIAVAATLRSGGRAGYSNFGPKVALAAPGGGSGSGIVSTFNAGSTGPGADSYAQYQGTSMATPHVAGVVSLMLSVNPALTPAQVLATLQATARTFPAGTGSDCSQALCGAGIVNAAAAVAAAAPVAAPPPPPAAAPPPPLATARVNWALASNGGVMTASSTIAAAYPPSGANDGDRSGARWNAGGGWNDATWNSYPDWLQADFGTVRSVAEVDVFFVQDDYSHPVEPTEALAFSQFGVADFEVQYWTGAAWQTVPGGSVTGNNKVWRKFSFTPVATSRLRVLVLGALGYFTRIVELEAYSSGSAAPAPTPTPTPTPAAAVNVALASNGGVASASSTYSGDYPVASVIDGKRSLAYWSIGRGWNDATPGVWPDWLQVDFNGTRRIAEIDVFTLQDDHWSPVEATEAMTFSRYGITDFDLQYWNGAAWAAVPGGSVSGNDRVWRKFTFAEVQTTAVRLVVRAGLSSYSRVTQLEVWGTTP